MDLEERNGVSADGSDVWLQQRGAWRQRNTCTWYQQSNLYTCEGQTASRFSGGWTAVREWKADGPGDEMHQGTVVPAIRRNEWTLCTPARTQSILAVPREGAVMHWQTRRWGTRRRVEHSMAVCMRRAKMRGPPPASNAAPSAAQPRKDRARGAGDDHQGMTRSWVTKRMAVPPDQERQRPLATTKDGPTEKLRGAMLHLATTPPPCAAQQLQTQGGDWPPRRGVCAQMAMVSSPRIRGGGRESRGKGGRPQVGAGSHPSEPPSPPSLVAVPPPHATKRPVGHDGRQPTGVRGCGAGPIGGLATSERVLSAGLPLRLRWAAARRQPHRVGGCRGRGRVRGGSAVAGRVERAEREGALTGPTVRLVGPPVGPPDGPPRRMEPLAAGARPAFGWPRSRVGPVGATTPGPYRGRGGPASPSVWTNRQLPTSR